MLVEKVLIVTEMVVVVIVTCHGNIICSFILLNLSPNLSGDFVEFRICKIYTVKFCY